MFTIVYSESKRLVTTFAWDKYDDANLHLTQFTNKHSFLDLKIEVVNINALGLSNSLYKPTINLGEYQIKTN
jgi:hypothetical protein